MPLTTPIVQSVKANGQILFWGVSPQIEFRDKFIVNNCGVGGLSANSHQHKYRVTLSNNDWIDRKKSPSVFAY